MEAQHTPSILNRVQDQAQIQALKTIVKDKNFDIDNITISNCFHCGDVIVICVKDDLSDRQIIIDYFVESGSIELIAFLFHDSILKRKLSCLLVVSQIIEAILLLQI